MNEIQSIYKSGITTIFACLFFGCFSACRDEVTSTIERPIDVWAFRSVLDKKPRMLTIALDSQLYVSYDLARCTLYKAWKGGVAMEGAPYTSKKNIQPTSWGSSYLSDSMQQRWKVERNGQSDSAKITNRGYTFKDNQIYIAYTIILSNGDSVTIKERPEFVENKKGEPGFERWFQTSGVPEGISVFLRQGDRSFALKSNGITSKTDYFEMLPKQFPPDPKASYDHLGKLWMEESDCFTCHQIEKADVGPSFDQIAQRYSHNDLTIERLTKKVQGGGSGAWGQNVMNAHPRLTKEEIQTMLDYVFTLKSKGDTVTVKPFVRNFAVANEKWKSKPGYGAPLEAVHPSYDLTTLHSTDFKPRVGGLAFLPDGRLLLTTWDTEGGVYLLDGFQEGDTAKITRKRIASGLHEPLGIEVVDGTIYVLQKHELTRLIDLDGDDVIDKYQAVCNSWQVTGDFHEFAFGLVYNKGHFYISLSMAMRLMDSDKQKFDRGRTLKIAPDGSYEWINYGLRTPNGIGLGVDRELFVTDNQGQWLPANKLIHVKKDEYHGMAWGQPDSLSHIPKMALPAIWLPDIEIGNSPSEPTVINDGPYKGQMLHGDVSHGGIKRDFLEKINGSYQGSVFRFSQGLAAGVNRLCWGPDGSLYIGEVGMVGGWTWKEKQYGLQRIRYNGKPTFEMLAIRAKPKGFEIEFTRPIKNLNTFKASDFFLRQWWYLPTAAYGGPKMDLERVKISRMELSDNGKKIYLEIPGLKKGHVVYFRIPDDLKSVEEQQLWSSEAWYTLNNIPEE